MYGVCLVAWPPFITEIRKTVYAVVSRVQIFAVLSKICTLIFAVFNFRGHR